MSFEMVRSSVYSAAQMKVSRGEMHKAEEGGRRRTGIWKGGEEGRRVWFQLPGPHLQYCHSYLKGFTLSLSVLLLISPSLSLL